MENKKTTIEIMGVPYEVEFVYNQEPEPITKDNMYVEENGHLVPSDAEMDRLFKEAVRLEIEQLKAMRIPVVCYDYERKQVYLEDEYGNRKYIPENPHVREYREKLINERNSKAKDAQEVSAK